MSVFDELMSQIGESRASELESLITQADYDYHVEHTPKVSDEVYDAWKDELRELRSESPVIATVGAPLPVSEWKKTSHGFSMGSLDKVNTPEELAEWVAGVGDPSDHLLVTEKLDGISIHVRYVKGVYTQAITRGDGHTGEDISVNVARMKGVPSQLPEKFTGSLRGEIVLFKSDLTRHFPDKANTRNTAGGVSKRYDGQGCEHLWVLFYQVVEGKDFATEDAQFRWFAQVGLRAPNWFVTSMTATKSPRDIWVDYQQNRRAELDYEIDGLVVRLNNLPKQIALGEKDDRPKGAIAFKFAPTTREATLERIDWQVGGTGRITPVAIFSPVRLLGAEVTNASLYNLKYIQDLRLDVGATILIARANDVIPRVLSVRKATGTTAQAPSECPVCKASVSLDGEYLVCSNSADCPAQSVGRIKRYVRELDIKEWGEGLIEKLVEGGHVKNVSDLYRLTPDRLSSIERMGDKSAQNVLKTLWAKNPIPLENLLGALSIPMCASSTIKLAMDAGFDTLEALTGATVAQLGGVHGLGPVKAQALVGWFSDHGQLVDDLLSVGVRIKAKVRGVLMGQSFCFTGSSVTPRAELEELAKSAGADVKGSVTKKLTFLVMSDPNSTTTKAQAARKNGTKCISEEEFLRMVGAE
jgi:DNA ligase (NAD+)